MSSNIKGVNADLSVMGEHICGYCCVEVLKFFNLPDVK